MPVPCRDGDVEAVLSLPHRNPAAAEEAATDDFRRDPRQLERWTVPSEDVKINEVVPPRRSAVSAGFERSAPRAVDAGAVPVQPGSDALEHVDLARLDAAGRLWPDIEEQVPVAAGAPRQDADDLVHGLDPVVRLPGPLGAQGHTRLPRLPVVVRPDHLLGRQVIGVRAHVAVGRKPAEAAVQAVVDDDRWLGLAQDAIGRRLVPGNRSAIPVEPKDVDPAVACDELADLALHALDVGRVALGPAVGVAPIHRRVVPADAQSGFADGLGQLAADVALERP